MGPPSKESQDANKQRTSFENPIGGPLLVIAAGKQIIHRDEWEFLHSLIVLKRAYFWVGSTYTMIAAYVRDGNK